MAWRLIYLCVVLSILDLYPRLEILVMFPTCALEHVPLRRWNRALVLFLKSTALGIPYLLISSFLLLLL